MTKGGRARLATALVGGSTAVLLGAVAAHAAGPAITVAPNPVASRQQTAVYGSGFCGGSGCSPVTVTIAAYAVSTRTCGPVQRTLAVDVQVQPDGRFGVSFTVLEGSGVYCVITTQTLADGSPSSATTGMTVAAADYAPGAVPSTLPPGAPTPHPPPPSASSEPPGSSPAASPPRASPVGQQSSAPLGTQRSPTTNRANGSGAPWWWWAIAAAALAGVAAAAVVIRRRAGGGGAPPAA